MANENMNQKTWMDFVDDACSGDYVKFEDGDEKVLKMVSNPIGGPIEFAQADGSVKTNDGLKIEVLVDDKPEIKQWTVTSKSVMSQLKSIAIKEGIGAKMAGSIIRVNVAGTGLQRKYFIKLLQRPGEAKA